MLVGRLIQGHDFISLAPISFTLLQSHHHNVTSDTATATDRSAASAPIDITQGREMVLAVVPE